MDVFKIEGQQVERGQPFTTHNAKGEEILHPANALELYDPEDLARYGVVKDVEPDPEPEPEPRRFLRKSLVMARVFALNKQAQVKALFDSNFELQARWFSPDWPAVYADDADLLSALAAIGLDAGEIASVTADVTAKA